MKKERVAVVQVLNSYEDLNLDELESLCETAGYDVVYSVFQKRNIDPSYCIGLGKLKELKEAVKRLAINKVVFENDLKPVQEYNLAKELGIPVIDRVRLILEIFAMHASSREAKLQIRMATLKYELSRAKEKVRLAKRGEQPGFHGLGAYEADVYYDEVHKRIVNISKKLKLLDRRRSLLRKKREELSLPILSLSGYTNAGKSTLFNRLALEDVEVAPQLFTTLSTTTRLVELNGKKAFLSDTVGFIKNLPTLLIDSFKSTLSEIAYSDLILLVADFSEPTDMVEQKIGWSLDILRSVGAHDVPVLVVLNKIDLLDEPLDQKLSDLSLDLPYVAISALKGTNMEALVNMMSDMMGGFVRISAKLANDGSATALLEELYQKGNVIELSYHYDSVKLIAETPYVLAEKIRKRSFEFSFA